MVFAINIKTSDWNKAITYLVNSQWTVAYKYDEFDAGIDFDLIVLTKGNDEIIFGWDNWFEGEIKCSEAHMTDIENHLGLPLERGEPQNLKPTVISLYWNK